MTVKEKKAKFDCKKTLLTAIAVLMFILSPVGVIIAALTGDTGLGIILCVCLILIMVGAGVGICVYTSRIGGSYDILLKEGRPTKAERKANKKLDALNGVYWCIVVAIFLCAGLAFDRWKLAGVIFPIAGVLYAAIYGIFKMALTKDDDR